MSKIIDDYGYRIKITPEEFEAITLVDNGIDPYLKLKNKTLHRDVKKEYKRRLVINISSFMKKSSKNRQLVFKNIHIRKKNTRDKNTIRSNRSYLNKVDWKKLVNLYKQILQIGRTKKKKFPKSRKTRRRKS